MKILLDTNFVITCIKQKIAFLEELGELFPEAEIVVPVQVLAELEKASKNKKLKIKDREAANLGLQLLKYVKKINLSGKYVDKGILEYVKEHKEDFVATIDKDLKKKLGKVIVIRGRKKLERA